jgi:hypothetical protein
MRRQSRTFEIHFSQIGLLVSRSAWDRASIRTRGMLVHVLIRCLPQRVERCHLAVEVSD